MSDYTIRYSKDLPVRHRVDVCVLGGGPAGVAAAVAAARGGASVLLVEQTGCLGGMGTSGLVPGFCTFTDNVNILVGGIGMEVIERLADAGGLLPGAQVRRDHPEDWQGIPFQPEALKRVYDAMVADAGVRLRFATALVDVVSDGGSVHCAVVSGKEGSYAVKASVYVDCTGDAQLCWLAGGRTELGDERGDTQGMTLCSVFVNVDWARYSTEWAQDSGSRRQDALDRAVADGHFRAPDLHHPGIWRQTDTVGGANVGHVYGSSGVSDEDLTAAYIEGRLLAQEYIGFYRKYVPGFENAELAATGGLMGVRETRRVMGDYELTVDDFERRAVFPDEIGRYNYPIDIHRSTNSADDYEEFEEEFRSRWRLGPGESYGIPYRCLCPADLDNVLVAGRCISTDRSVQGSVRVMPGCYLTGQAAGTAGAMAVAKDGMPSHVDSTLLRERLREDGAYLPDAG